MKRKIRMTKAKNDNKKILEAVIKLFNNYFSIVSEAKYKAKHGKRLKNIKSSTNASKITRSTCTSISR